MFGMDGHYAIIRHCNLSGAFLKDAEFYHSDWTGSTVIKAYLLRTVLSGSKLDSCDFSLTDFTGGSLEGASFVSSRFWESDFTGAHLQNVNFTNADLKGAKFFGAEFDNTNFKGAKNIPKYVKQFIDENGYATGIWQDKKE
jgi:uncharacterized protein YjbI with pentapeptide repeats